MYVVRWREGTDMTASSKSGNMALRDAIRGSGAPTPISCARACVCIWSGGAGEIIMSESGSTVDDCGSELRLGEVVSMVCRLGVLRSRTCVWSCWEVGGEASAPGG
jgi:hypothetical protein